MRHSVIYETAKLSLLLRGGCCDRGNPGQSAADVPIGSKAQRSGLSGIQQGHRLDQGPHLFRAALLNMTQGQCHHNRHRQTDPYLHLRLATDVVKPG